MKTTKTTYQVSHLTVYDNAQTLKRAKAFAKRLEGYGYKGVTIEKVVTVTEVSREEIKQ